ncbi:MAG: winged helix-turn-helix transcriptional regulator [archaeon]
MIDIDVKDRKILYYLSQDGRASNTHLSKKVGLSKNAVAYRIERLKKLKVIKHFASIVNLGSLNFTTFTVLLKFNEDIYENSSIIEYFKSHDYVDWMVSLSGQWDLFIEFVSRDFNHLTEIIEEIISYFKDTLETYELSYSRVTLRVEHLVKDFYQDLKLSPIKTSERTKQIFKLDKIDKQILEVLNKDSSLPYLSIAEKLKTSIDVVRYRISNLVSKGVIVKFFPEISLPKLGYTEYLYSLRLKNLSSEKFRDIQNDIKNNNNITYAFVDSVSLRIIFVCAFKSPEAIDHLSRGLRKKYMGSIDKQEYLIIKEQMLFNLFPRGLTK